MGTPPVLLWLPAFFGFFLSSSAWSLVRFLLDGEWYSPLALGSVGGFALGVLDSVVLATLFVSLSHYVRRDWVLVLAWGGVSAVVGIGWRAVAPVIVSGLETPAPLGRTWIAGSFLAGLFLMSGLVYAVRAGGLRWESLALGCLLSFVLGRVLTLLILQMPFSTVHVLGSAVNGALFGSLIYAGFYLSLPGGPVMPSRMARLRVRGA
jgi:hypothetical protein